MSTSPISPFNRRGRFAAYLRCHARPIDVHNTATPTRAPDASPGRNPCGTRFDNRCFGDGDGCFGNGDGTSFKGDERGKAGDSMLKGASCGGKDGRGWSAGDGGGNACGSRGIRVSGAGIDGALSSGTWGGGRVGAAENRDGVGAAGGESEKYREQREARE